jgi:hypothetical protein
LASGASTGGRRRANLLANQIVRHSSRVRSSLLHFYSGRVLTSSTAPLVIISQLRSDNLYSLYPPQILLDTHFSHHSPSLPLSLTYNICYLLANSHQTSADKLATVASLLNHLKSADDHPHLRSILLRTTTYPALPIPGSQYVQTQPNVGQYRNRSADLTRLSVAACSVSEEVTGYCFACAGSSDSPVSHRYSITLLAVHLR